MKHIKKQLVFPNLILYPLILIIVAATPLYLVYAQDSPIKSTQQIIDVFQFVATFLYALFFVVAVIFIIIAAFNFLFAQASEEKIATAKKQIYYAVIAIIIALVSVGFDQIIKRFLESGT